MKKIIIILLSLFIISEYFSQNRELDSLYTVVKNSKNENDIAYAHGRLCWLLINTNVNDAQAHIDSARIIYEKLNDQKGIAIAYYKDGVISRKTGEFEKGLLSIDKYLEYADSTSNQKMKNDGLYQKAVIYQQQGKFNESLNIYYDLLDQARADSLVKGIGFLLNSIGIVYKNIGNYDKAKESYYESIEVLKNTKFQNDLANSYGNLSVVYALDADYEIAIEYQEKANAINVELNDNWGKAIGLMNLGELFFDKNELDVSLSNLERALVIQEENNFKEKNSSYTLLGKVYLAKNDFIQAEHYFKKALASDLSNLYTRDVHEGLATLYKQKQNDQLALYHFEKFTSIKDSLTGIENIKNINQLQFQYEAIEKDNAIIAKDLKIKDQENLILLNEARNLKYIIVAAIASIGLLFSFFYFRQRQRLKNKEIEALKTKQEVTKLESLIEGEEKERERLAQDLHDGINGDLSVIKYKITSLDEMKFSENEKLEFNAAISMLDNAIEQVRSISHDLAPPSLQNYNLVEAIQQYCMKISSSYPLVISFQDYGKVISLPKEKETAVYRIVQELINNTVKHANASEVLVQMNFHTTSVHITVEDNGSGYDVQANNNGLGLKNISSRATFLGANVVVESDSKGTITTLDIDLNEMTND